MGATFSKLEKICGRSTIDHLYKDGKRFVVWPLRVSYLPVDQLPTQVLIWAPKSLFKRAVDRNHLRRQMREAYRLNKQMLYDSGCHYLIAFNYIDRKKQSYHLIEKAMRKVLSKLTSEVVQ